MVTYLGQPVILGEPIGMQSGGEQTLQDYLAGLGALVVVDGTLSGSALLNKGTLGSGVTITPTDITLNSNGMVYNGTTSLITIANHASLNALASFCYLFWCNPNASTGEGSNPRLWSWGNSAHTGYHTEASAALTMSTDYATVDGAVTTANNFVSQGAEQILFCQHRSSDALSRAYKGMDGAVVEATYSGTPTAGTGGIVTRPDALIIGNTLNAANTFMDYIKAFAIFGRELTADEMLQATLLAGLN